jgi:hypothetical protein
VYSSVDIPKGTAIAFVPARHVMHRSEFNRSEIWPSLAPLSPAATYYTRLVDLSVGELCTMLMRARRVFFAQHALPCSCCLRAQQLPLVLAALSVRSLHPPSSCPLLRAAISLSLPRPAATCRPRTEARPSLGGKKSCRRGRAKRLPAVLRSLLTHLR